jgi:hypothetical protein
MQARTHQSAPRCQPARPFMHSDVQRFRQASFQAGTWWGMEQTERWQASTHASWAAWLGRRGSHGAGGQLQTAGFGRARPGRSAAHCRGRLNTRAHPLHGTAARRAARCARTQCLRHPSRPQPRSRASERPLPRRRPPETPHTVMQELWVGSLASLPRRRSRRSDVHTRSQTKLPSLPTSSLMPLEGGAGGVAVPGDDGDEGQRRTCRSMHRGGAQRSSGRRQRPLAPVCVDVVAGARAQDPFCDDEWHRDGRCCEWLPKRHGCRDLGLVVTHAAAQWHQKCRGLE